MPCLPIRACWLSAHQSKQRIDFDFTENFRYNSEGFPGHQQETFLKQEIDVKGVRCVAQVKLHKVGLHSVNKLVTDEVDRGRQESLTATVVGEPMLLVEEVAGAFQGNEEVARLRHVQISGRI